MDIWWFKDNLVTFLVQNKKNQVLSYFILDVVTPLLLFLHLVENIVLAVPVLLSHLNISARHLMLQRSVGVLPIETESLENSRALVVATLTTIPLGFCIQSALFWLYTQRGHIWAAAVREERAEQEAAIDEEMEDERVMTKTKQRNTLKNAQICTLKFVRCLSLKLVDS